MSIAEFPEPMETPVLIDLSSQRPDTGTTYEVHSTSEYQSLAPGLSGGDVVKFHAGKYDFLRLWHTKGFEGNPVWHMPYGDGAVNFEFSNIKQMDFLGHDTVFESIGFSNSITAAIQTIGPNHAFWKCRFYDIGQAGNEEQQWAGIGVMATGSKTSIFNCSFTNLTGDGVYCANYYNGDSILDTNVRNNSFGNVGGSGVQVNPHKSGNMDGLHRIAGNYFEGVGHKYDKAAINLVSQDPQQMLGEMYVSENLIKRSAWGIKIQNTQKCLTHVINNRVTQCKYGVSLRNKADQAQCIIEDNFSWNNSQFNFEQKNNTSGILKNNSESAPAYPWNRGEYYSFDDNNTDEQDETPDKDQQIDALNKRIQDYSDRFAQIRALTDPI